MIPVILVDRISFGYKGSKDREKKSILEDFSLEVLKGEIIIIEGKSGTGKTTLLRLLSWMETPDSGSMFFAGKAYQEYHPPDLRKQAVMIPQIPVMFPGDVRSNLLMGVCHGPTDAELGYWLGRLGMPAAFLDKSASSLSVGQKQRVAFIRGMLVKPKVLLLDEPASGLDLETSELLRGLINELVENDDMSVILCSHQANFHESLPSKKISLERM